MIFEATFQRDALLAAANHVKGAVPTRSGMASLTHILFERNDVEGKPSFSLTGSDLEISARATLEGSDDTVKSPTDYGFCMPATALLKALERFTSRFVRMTHSDGHATLECGRSRVKIPTMPRDEYPAVFLNDENPQWMPIGSDIVKMLRVCQISMHTDASRPHLCGAYLHHERGELKVASTDGHRLTLCITSHIEELVTLNEGIIIPAAAVNEIIRFGKVLQFDVSLSSDRTRLSCRNTDGDIVVTRLIDGTFPAYQNVIPRLEEVNSIEVSVSNLRESLKLASDFSDARIRSSKFNLSETNHLTITSACPEKGESQQVIDCEGESGKGRFGNGELLGVNVVYMAQALSVIPTEYARIYASDKLRPMVLKPVDANSGIDITAIVMPMRT